MFSTVHRSSEVEVVNISHKSQQKKSICKGTLNLTSNVNLSMKSYKKKQKKEKIDVIL